MSDLKVGDRVYHSQFRAKGTVVSIHIGRPWVLLRVKPDKMIDIREVWLDDNVKPIVTVRG